MYLWICFCLFVCCIQLFYILLSTEVCFMIIILHHSCHAIIFLYFCWSFIAFIWPLLIVHNVNEFFFFIIIHCISLFLSLFNIGFNMQFKCIKRCILLCFFSVRQAMFHFVIIIYHEYFFFFWGLMMWMHFGVSTRNISYVYIHSTHKIYIILESFTRRSFQCV